MEIKVGETYHYDGTYFASPMKEGLVEVIELDFGYQGEPRAIVKPLNKDEQVRLVDFNPTQRVIISTLTNV